MAKTKIVTGNSGLKSSNTNKGHSGEESKVKIVGKRC